MLFKMAGNLTFAGLAILQSRNLKNGLFFWRLGFRNCMSVKILVASSKMSFLISQCFHLKKFILRIRISLMFYNTYWPQRHLLFHRYLTKISDAKNGYFFARDGILFRCESNERICLNRFNGPSKEIHSKGVHNNFSSLSTNADVTFLSIFYGLHN